MSRFAPVIADLIKELGKLPGIGHKTAQRLAFHILAQPKAESTKLAQAILHATEETKLCSECCNLTDQDPCLICTDTSRDRTTLCVVENPRDVAAIERIHEYRGLYHVLHGSINPMQDVGPENIKLAELVVRLRKHSEISEVIIATNPNIEGEATALYISRLLKPTGITVTRPASGLPMGGDLEYADDITLAKAIAGRQEI